MKKICLFLTLLIGLFLVSINAKAIEGIDVSLWQGKIDFEEVKNDGIKIVYIRSSAGNSYKDRDFEQNYKEALENYLDIGFYHFVTARNVREAKEQARFFAKVIAGKKADCRLAMDFEVLRGLTKKEVNDISRAFLSTLKELTQKELVIYSDLYNARNMFDEELLQEYPLWLAEYTKRPSINSWIGWQYTDRGKVLGISGNVDRDTFKSEIYLSDKNEIKEPNIKEDDKIKTIYYRVHFGDNLTKIARKYHVTLNSILKDNNIKNPNLIFPNEVIKIKTDYDYNVSSNGDKNTYIVKKNDNLTKIARIFDTLVSNLVTWDNIKNPNLIYPGQILNIKPRNNDHLIKYVIKEDDTLLDIAKDYKISILELKIINKIKDVDKILAGDILYIPESYILEE